MAVAAGTMAETLRALVRTRSGSPRWPEHVVGLVGRGIAASRTPRMHEAEAARLGLDGVYVAIDFDALRLPDAALPSVLVAAAAVGFAGVNVTFPFKQAVMGLLARLAPDAARIGAVNTVVFGPGGATGHNTDGWGFAQSVRAGLPGARLDRIALVGAGGAGAAVADALAALGAGTLAVFDVDARRSGELAARFGAAVEVAGRVEDALAGACGLVNTTPVGMAKFPGTPVAAALLAPPLWVADVVYFPPETELLRLARAHGCRTLPGAGMAISQAVRAFELFTGRSADPAAMRRHFEAAP